MSVKDTANSLICMHVYMWSEVACSQHTLLTVLVWCTPSSLHTFITYECFMMIHTYVHTVVVVVKSFQSPGAMLCTTVCVICKLFIQRLGVHTYIRTCVYAFNVDLYHVL